MDITEATETLNALLEVMKIIEYLNSKHEEEIPLEIIAMVEEDVREELGDKSDFLTGYKKEFWKLKKQFLSELGYEWESPLDKYPNVHFD